MPFQFVVINGVTPTAVGAQSFTSAGFGVAQGYRVIVGGANQSANPSNNSRLGFGWCDLTNQASIASSALHAQATTDADRYSSISLVALLGTYNATLLEGAHNGLVTDGISIDFIKVDTVAHYITVVLFKGLDNVKCFNSALSIAGVNDITSIGFKPSLVEMGSIGHSAIGSSPTGLLNIGWAHNSSANVVTQRYIGQSNINNQASSILSSVHRDDCCIGDHYYDGQNWKGSAESFDTSGFRINTGSDNPGGDYVFGLAMKFADPDVVKITTETSPTATGTWSVTGPGFEPHIVFLGVGAFANVNVIETDDDAGTIGFGVFTSAGQSFFGLSGDDADAANTSESSNFSSTNVVDLKKWNGSAHADNAQGAFSAMTSTGYNLSFPTTVNATARKWFSVAIKNVPATNAGTLNIHLPTINMLLTGGSYGEAGYFLQMDGLQFAPAINSAALTQTKTPIAQALQLRSALSIPSIEGVVTLGSSAMLINALLTGGSISHARSLSVSDDLANVSIAAASVVREQGIGSLSSFTQAVVSGGALSQIKTISADLLQSAGVVSAFVIESSRFRQFDNLLSTVQSSAGVVTASQSVVPDAIAILSELVWQSLESVRNLQLDALSLAGQCAVFSITQSASMAGDSVVVQASSADILAGISRALLVDEIALQSAINSLVVGSARGMAMDAVVSIVSVGDVAAQQVAGIGVGAVTVSSELLQLIVGQDGSVAFSPLMTGGVLSDATLVQARDAVASELIVGGFLDAVIASNGNLRVFDALQAMSVANAGTVTQSQALSGEPMAAIAVINRALINNAIHITIYSPGIFSLTEKTGIQSVH